MSLPSNLTVKEMEESGAPVSAMKQWYNRVKSASGGMQRAKIHAAAAGQGLRQGGEAVLVGGALGALHVVKGLDLGKEGSTTKLPIDAVVGVLGLLGGAAMATEEYGVDMRNAGAAALSVFSFRKTYDLLAKKKKDKGEKVVGTFAGDDEGFVNANVDFGAEDPIIAAARML